MDAALFVQIIVAIVAIGSFVIATITLKHKFKTQEQQQSKENIREAESHAERMKKIEEEIVSLKKETEVIKKEREQIVKSIYDEIKTLRSKHESDVSMVQAQIKEMIREIKEKNEADHKELKSILEKINLSLNTVCTRFSDHVVNHEVPEKTTARRVRK